MPAPASEGKALADKLFAALDDFALGPVLGGHNRPIIWGVTSGGLFIGGMTPDLFFARASQILLESHRVFRSGNSICA